MQRYRTVASVLALACVLVVIGCGGGGGGSMGGAGVSGTVSVFISDPPTCMPPTGPFTNVWVTITRIEAHVSSSAGPGDGGWVTLVDRTGDPAQLDLLALADPNCILTMLGATTALPVGSYQQLRLYLLSNDPGPGEAVPSPNACAGTGGYNCVVHETNGPQLLLLSSQAETGIKIPPGRIVGGAIEVSDGEAVDINIDFDACTSIIQQGNGAYRLRPTLHAGEISPNDLVITGRVVDDMTLAPIAGATVTVSAQLPDAAGVDRVVFQTLADATDGTFSLCPLPQASYDIVISVAGPSGEMHHPSVTLGVPTGAAMGDVPLTAIAGAMSGQILGEVTTASTGGGPGLADVDVSALLTVTGPAGPLAVTVPALPGSMSLFPTSPGMGCPPGTGCGSYALIVPPGEPTVGTYAATGTIWNAPVAGAAAYTVDARTFDQDGSGDVICSPPVLSTNLDDMGMVIAVGSGASVTASTLAFTGCD